MLTLDQMKPYFIIREREKLFQEVIFDYFRIENVPDFEGRAKPQKNTGLRVLGQSCKGESIEYCKNRFGPIFAGEFTEQILAEQCCRKCPPVSA